MARLQNLSMLKVLRSALGSSCRCSCHLNSGSVNSLEVDRRKRFAFSSQLRFFRLLRVRTEGSKTSLLDSRERKTVINIRSAGQKSSQSDPSILKRNEITQNKLKPSPQPKTTDNKLDMSPNLDEPVLDWEYLVNPANTEHIKDSILSRKGVGNIDQVIELWKKLNDRNIMMEDFSKTQAEEEAETRQRLLQSALLIPNKTHPGVPVGDESEAKLIEMVGKRREFDFQPASVIQLGEELDLLRVENVGLTSGPRTYYFKHELALLEQALIKYTLRKLIAKGFQLISVPDLIHRDVIEGCGFPTTGERSQVYRLDHRYQGNICLAGTAEMSLAGYFMNRNLVITQLPYRVAAVSRCYRAETSDIAEEKGIYRVHQFTKVEMFCVTADETGEESEHLMTEVMTLQKELFAELGLHFRILDMPTQELGAPAYRKFDIEAWMPAKQMFGEISSTSNCTDYQSRRLHIRYRDADNNLKYAHTVNGTACAVPRMVMAIMESNQNEDGSVNIPAALQPYMRGVTALTKPASPPQLHFMKLTKAARKTM